MLSLPPTSLTLFKNFKLYSSLIAVVVLLISAANTQAAIYSYSGIGGVDFINNTRETTRAGQIKNLDAHYNSNTEQFNWGYEITSTKFDDGTPGELHNAFWMVITDGPDLLNASESVQKSNYVALMGDLGTGTISAYHRKPPA